MSGDHESSEDVPYVYWTPAIVCPASLEVDNQVYCKVPVALQYDRGTYGLSNITARLRRPRLPDAIDLVTVEADGTVVTVLAVVVPLSVQRGLDSASHNVASRESFGFRCLPLRFGTQSLTSDYSEQ